MHGDDTDDARRPERALDGLPRFCHRVHERRRDERHPRARASTSADARNPRLPRARPVACRFVMDAPRPQGHAPPIYHATKAADASGAAAAAAAAPRAAAASIPVAAAVAASALIPGEATAAASGTAHARRSAPARDQAQARERTALRAAPSIGRVPHPSVRRGRGGADSHEMPWVAARQAPTAPPYPCDAFSSAHCHTSCMRTSPCHSPPVQFTVTVARDHSRTKTSEPSAVSWHVSSGSP